MSYNNMSTESSLLYTAGKITIVTTLIGVVTFAVIFLLNIGTQEFKEAVAQNRATTTVNVLNTPPTWVTGFEGREEVESSAASPTNSGDDVAWVGTAEDANGADYYLIVCSGTSTPAAPVPSDAGAPSCAASTVQWAVSTATVSGAEARTATTTIDRTTTSSFAESNDWFAWVCDADPVYPRCFSTYSTGTAASNSSPFKVNSRPVFTDLWNDSPTDPGDGVVFTATSSDADTDTAADTVRLWVCAAADFGTGTSSTECGPGGTLASSTLSASDPTATFNIPIPYQDQDYAAYGYIIDNHGHRAIGAQQGAQDTLTVSNVAPSVGSSTISLNEGLDMVLVNAATQTPNFTLSFVVSDNNSCENFSSGDEVIDYALSVYRSGIGNSACNATGTADYDPNNCYQSEVGSSVWNISCAATTTVSDCTGAEDLTQTWECTFPLWYIADPTDLASTSPYSAEDWRASVSAIDDNFATGTENESDSGVDLFGLLAFALDTAEIPYGSIEPGSDTGTLSASTTIRATGNVGVDERLEGESMCPTYSSSTPCPNSATSTIPASNQQYGTSSVNYGDVGAYSLSSTTAAELELNVLKSTSTSVQATGITFWGIAIPGTVSLSGDYFGQNTFYAKVSEPAEWY